MYLDQVVSGAGTSNQVTRRLGTWSAVGQNRQFYAWVPLTDGGLTAPVVVNLSGDSTLRITTTTGLCYPNYFMLRHHPHRLPLSRQHRPLFPYVSWRDLQGPLEGRFDFWHPEPADLRAR